MVKSFNNSKKGFTLLELLAVILILGILALIAVPTVNGIIDESKRNSFKTSIKNLQKAVEEQCQVERIKGDVQTTMYTFNNEGITPSLDVKGLLPISGTMTVDDECNAELSDVTNGEYCASIESNNLMLSKDCASLDLTTPTVLISLQDVTSSTVKIVAMCTDSESGIIKYEYSKDNGTNWIDNGQTSTYTFNNLTTGSYSFKVRCTNGVGSSATSTTITNQTATINTPTYSVSPTGYTSGNKTVTINYPTGYTNEYSIDGGLTWLEYNEPIEFTENGTVIARVTDGTNYVNGSSQTVTGIDKTGPSASLTANMTSNSASLTATCTDLESGITKYEYSKDNGINWIDNGQVSTYTFNNLTTGSYSFKVRCTNGVEIKSISSVVTNETIEIPVPTYSVSPEGVAESKTVTINYPTGYTNEYSIDGGLTWNTYTTPIVFTENGTVIARVTDGTNYKTGSSYTISNIVKLATNVYYNNSTHTNGQDKTVQEVLEELYESAI